MDVTALDDDEIMQHCFMGALTLLMKHSCSCDIMLQMDRRVQLKQSSLNEVLVQALFYYLLNGSEHVTVRFLQALAQRLSQHEGNIMTLAEQLKQKGEVKGFARGKLEGKLEGRMEGRLEGQLEGKQETARNMLNSGISRNMLQELTSIAEEELNMLKY